MSKIGVLSVAVMSAYVASAVVPEVSNVKMSQDNATRTVTITYDLSAPAVVTFDILTNDVATGVWASIGQQCLSQASGDVAKKVDKSSGTICWQPNRAWPSDASRREGVKALVKAWALNGLPDYMVIDLVLSENIRFYVSEDALPGGIGSDVYRTDKIVLRKIPAAMVHWRMGAPKGENGQTYWWNGNQSSEEAETPHRVTLTHDYYMGVFEVTQAQYQRVMNSNPSACKGYVDSPMRPVETVAWPRGAAWPATEKPSNSSFFGKLATHSVLVDSFDLPTEAQWEFACRAGVGAALYNGTELGAAVDEGKYRAATPALTPIAWAWGNSSEGTTDGAAQPHVVGTKAANAWGLYDMIGNVAEWCRDLNYTRICDLTDTDPAGPTLAQSGYSSGGEYYVVRGGSWNSQFGFAYKCRSGARGSNKYAWSFSDLGFRLSCAAEIK